MKLYFAPGACSLAPHIVAREAGVEVELVKVDLGKRTLGDGTDYRTISPRGYVPLLELDDGTRLTETSVLVQVLADRAPQSGLAPPPGTMARYRVQEWLNIVATELHKTFSPWLWHKETAASARQTALDKLAEQFRAFDAALAAQPYLTGTTFTVADAYAFTIINWARFLKLDLGPYPHLVAWLDRVAARPKVQEAIHAERRAK